MSLSPRHHPLRATLLTLALTWATLMAPSVSARDRGDHDRAREAVVAGQILPLGQVLERLERDPGGRVLEIELESDDGQWIYEVKLLQPGGLLQRLEVDATTGEVIGRRLKSRRRDHGEPR
ncbi:MAG: PepSY domain-containing protein [Hydrogenophaga sp.]|nr:PepSY domain-containing protein [Hydrogenophaga sp.]